jgi:hypothetical protein
VENIRTLLELIGCTRIKVGGNGWVHACCPFAKWRHSGGHDARPSFAIASSLDGSSNYKCLSCQAKGDLRTLVYKLESLSGTNLSKVMEFVQRFDKPSLETIKKKIETATYWGTKSAEIGGVKVNNAPFFLLHPEDGKPLETPLAESELQAFTTDFPEDVWKYLTLPKGVEAPNGQPARGLSPESIKEWELCWHPHGRRIGVPVRDVKGRLMSISGRSFHSWQKPKFLHTTGFKRDLYLYGEDRVQKGGLGILVEGFFDVQRIRQAGFPYAVGVMGSYLSLIQTEKLVQFFTSVLIIPDGDKAGYEGAKQWSKALEGRLPVSICEVAEGSDPDELNALQIGQQIGKYFPNLTINPVSG